MDAIKNAQISAAIAARIQQGQALPEAMDAVLGAGTYAKLVDDLYHAYRAKAGK